MEKKQRSPLENMDRISNLPDPLRSHIVSFLPLQDAIRNKILSKGWKHICSSLTNLDFVQILHRDDLKDIIDRTLILHTGQHIQRFRVWVKIGTNSVDALHLNTWISYALRHNVLEFYLDTYSGEEIGMLPHSLFHSSTLVVLTLRNLHLNLPSRVHFPVLKTLKLSFVTFHNEHLTCKLLSDCCPRLLNLKIRYCYPGDFTTLSISSTSLSFLKLEDYICDADDDDALNIKLSTPNLREIYVYSTKLPEVSSETLSSLIVVTFYLCLLPSTSACMGNLACKMLAGLHNVETLRLKCWFIDLLTRSEVWPMCLPTSCRCLKRLELKMGSTKSQLQLLNLIIRCYPNLQVLFISFYNPSSEEDNIPQGLLNVEQHLQSKVLLENLRTVKVKHFQGSANELEFVGYLLENAIILERMDIHCGYLKGENVESRMRISDILLTFARVSPHARIFIS